jgi:hypothetical protein
VSEEGRLALVRELERADEEVAAVLAEVDELLAGTESVRVRALELEAFFARLPAERAATAAANAEAAEGLARAHAAAQQAASELLAAAAADDRERRAAARRFEARAHDALTVAARRKAAAEASSAALEERAGEAEREAPALERRARELAAALRTRPRLAEAGAEPDAGLAGVSAWASGARAALLVAHAALGAERDAVIRQANELAALVLGEPTASGTALAIRRIERELESR